jgi:exopolysaccharide biosynthesis polyprenyl glycosylphosphotransferase
MSVINPLGLRISKWSLLLMSGDIAAFCLAMPLGLFVLDRRQVDPWFFLEVYKWSLLPVLFTYVVVFYVANLYNHYQDFRRHENFSHVILACLVGTLAVVLLFCYPAWRIIPRNFVEWHAVAFVWLMVLWRYSFSAVALPVRLQRNVLIIGAGEAGRLVAATIAQRSNSGFRVIGFVDDNPRKAGDMVHGVPILGDSQQLPELVNRYLVGLAVVAITHEKTGKLVEALARLSFQGTQLTDMPGLYEFLTGKVPTDHITDIWLFRNSLNRRMLYYRHIKRLTDLVLAVFYLALTWPLMLIIALAIKLDSPGPVFFRQERLGQNGKAFEILKFRTMVEDAEKLGPQFASLNDVRITRVGGVLRALRLDELPQLLNILKGEMSFIGPRPERGVFIKEFMAPVPEVRPGRRATDPPGSQIICGYREKVPHYSYRLLVRPGITGWAQVMHPYTASLEETKEKVEYDLYYIKHMGFLLDMAILLKTIRIVLFGRGR